MLEKRSASTLSLVRLGGNLFFFQLRSDTSRPSFLTGPSQHNHMLSIQLQLASILEKASSQLKDACSMNGLSFLSFFNHFSFILSFLSFLSYLSWRLSVEADEGSEEVKDHRI